MTEPDVTLTDYALTVLCSYFAFKLWKKHPATLHQKLWIAFFASLALGAFTGGSVHGFFLDPASWGNQLLWPATLLLIGITAASGWMICGSLLSRSGKIKGWSIFASLTFLIYALVVIFYSRRFVIVIVNYMPAMIAMLIAAILKYKERRSKGYLFITCGILISFVAAFIQQAKIGIHPEYFNHNSLYHLVQGIALWVLYRGACYLLESAPHPKDSMRRVA